MRRVIVMWESVDDNPVSQALPSTELCRRQKIDRFELGEYNPPCPAGLLAATKDLARRIFLRVQQPPG